MKKLTLLFMAFMVFTLNITSFAKEKVDTTFTFQDFVPTSESGINTLKRTKILGKSRVEYFAFSGKKPNITKEMNKAMEKFIQDFKSTGSKTYTVTSKVTANNSYYISVLFDAIVNDSKSGTSYKESTGISFNLKNGKPLMLKDIFLQGYEPELESQINSKFSELGLPQTDRFKAVSKNTNYYFDNDALVFIYNNNLGTSFADGQTFIPFVLTNLIGLLK